MSSSGIWIHNIAFTLWLDTEQRYDLKDFIKLIVVTQHIHLTCKIELSIEKAQSTKVHVLGECPVTPHGKYWNFNASLEPCLPYGYLTGVHHFSENNQC